MYFYLHFIFIKISKIVCTPRPSPHPFLLEGWEGAGGWGIEPPTKFSKKGGGLAGSQFLYIKNKLKSEIFKDKKGI